MYSSDDKLKNFMFIKVSRLSKACREEETEKQNFSHVHMYEHKYLHYAYTSVKTRSIKNSSMI